MVVELLLLFVLACLAFMVYQHFRNFRRLESSLSLLAQTSQRLPQSSLDVQREAEAERLRSEYIASLVTQGVTATLDQRIFDIDNDLLLREISHGMNTPLHQIQVALRRMRPLADISQDVSLWRTLDNAEHSIQLCQVIVSAYREVVAVSGSVSAGQTTHLRDLLSNAFTIYLGRIQGFGRDSSQANVQSPDSVPGFGNHLLAGIILPLIQNAVEAAPIGSPLSCTVGHTSVGHVVTVRNYYKVKPDLEAMQAAGYTSKGGAHEGLGLSTVRTLIGRLNIDLRFDIDNEKRIVAELLLPRREETMK